jgi:hypothetical protein
MDERTIVHYERGVVGRSSVMNKNLVQIVARKIMNYGTPQFQNFLVNIHKIQAEIITVMLDHDKFCTRRFQRMLKLA